MPRPCTICIHPDRETIDQQLLAGTPYRTVGKQHSVGVSAVFRHRRDHLTRLMATAVEARGVQELGYGDDLLGQLEFLNGKTLKPGPRVGHSKSQLAKAGLVPGNFS